MQNAQFIIDELVSIQNPEKACILRNFFKTGKGEYGEGDLFLGINVPLVRNIVKENNLVQLEQIQILLDSEYHEIRLTALLFLIKLFRKSKKEKEKEAIFNFYLSNTEKINNWDLVDVTCRDIVGKYLLDKKDKREILYCLAESRNLWEQRMAIVSTWMFIKHYDFTDTLILSEKLLSHPHDLIQKAVGWMLREIGKKNKEILVSFLEVHFREMPRTMLRYAIERLPEWERKYFMQK